MCWQAAFTALLQSSASHLALPLFMFTTQVTACEDGKWFCLFDCLISRGEKSLLAAAAAASFPSGYTNWYSRALPPSCPLLQASTTASRSTMAPRALLIRKAPFFILPITSLENMPLQPIKQTHTMFPTIWRIWTVLHRGEETALVAVQRWQAHDIVLSRFLR